LKGSKKRLVFDASVLIELAYATELGKKALELMKLNDVYVTELAIVETYYILCRKLGEEKAAEKIENLLESGYVEIFNVSPIKVGKIKCSRAISIADCYTIALAEKIKGVAIFARKEKELIKEMRRQEFSTQIMFLEDL